MQKKYLYLLVFVFIIFSQQVFSITFTLKENINITKDYVYLYDIVDISDTSRKIKNKKLFKTPLAEIDYDAYNMYKYLTEAAGGDDYILIGQSINIKPIAKQDVLSTAKYSDNQSTVKVVSKNKDNAILTEALSRVLPQTESDGEYYEITYLYKIPNVEINDYQVVAAVKNGENKDIKNIRFNIKDYNGKTINWFETVIEAHKVKDVYKAKTNIEKGSIIKAQDFQKVAMRSDRLSNDVISDIDIFTGKAAEYHMKKDTVLRTFHIKTDMLIQRGQTVKATLNTNGIKIELQTVAMENGYENKNIKLKNSITGRRINAFVYMQIQTELMYVSSCPRLLVSNSKSWCWHTRLRRDL